eukprot:1193900-Amphidinium_carterae.1
MQGRCVLVESCRFGVSPLIRPNFKHSIDPMHSSIGWGVVTNSPPGATQQVIDPHNAEQELQDLKEGLYFHWQRI